MNAIYLLDPYPYEVIYGPDERAAIAKLVKIVAPAQTRQSLLANPGVLAEVDLILSGWGMAPLDEAFLQAAPRLKAVFYGAGSVRYFTTEAAWQRGITIVTAYAANDMPVVEYTLAAIFFSLKQIFRYAQEVKRLGAYPKLWPVAGAYKSTIGLVSLGMIGRNVARRLQSFDVKVIAYDPFVTPEQGTKLGVEMVSLDEIFTRADVVSLHTPWLPETEGMITGAHLASMKPGAAFINTARGAVVKEDEMIAVLQQRPDLWAVLDVTWPEPPEPGSPLYSLPNVFLTPHIAGSVNNECHRMGQLIVSELRRYVRGRPLRWAVTKEQVAKMA